MLTLRRDSFRRAAPLFFDALRLARQALDA
jgi:hypothetical protein